MHKRKTIYIYIYDIMQQNMKIEKPLHKKSCRHIAGIIIDNIMFSLFIGKHGGILLLITKIGYTM